MTQEMQTISDRIQQKLDDLTRAERQLALSILENYPRFRTWPSVVIGERRQCVGADGGADGAKTRLQGLF